MTGFLPSSSDLFLPRGFRRTKAEVQSRSRFRKAPSNGGPREIDLSALWPVGSMFISGDATDPAVLLGFGTWAPLNGGRPLAGIDAGARGWKRTA